MNQHNNLINETSPYLLQHADNPVNWYPWGEEAFSKAKKENKPIFLSIGYSTCHWCHVMAHESFENQEIAEILNDHFIAIKVDKEERPDIDSIYMGVCQAFTGSGGWPTSILMTYDQKPFFAGTYYPPKSRHGMMGFADLLMFIVQKWKDDKKMLMDASDDMIRHLNTITNSESDVTEDIVTEAVSYYKQIYDEKNGGFGGAPKFPAPHNLLFLMGCYEVTGDQEALKMAEKTLTQMYKGGIFDHIGFGFSRYSTDQYFLVPHFEKMLYDNALLMIAYTKMFSITKNNLYKEVAVKTADYVMREMTDEDGGFYSAQDADSNGVEGKYYVFERNEIIKLLGDEQGEKFCEQYDITAHGNFEGKNIPNLLKSNDLDNKSNEDITKLYEYRKSRNKIHLDDKILTAWNSLMISAFSIMHRVFKEETYLNAAEKASHFIDEKLAEKDTLFVSFRKEKKSGVGFLDDYAYYILALLNLYEATLENKYLERAQLFSRKVIRDFYDQKNSGFYLYGNENEQLIMKPKETYDGAIPSGNSVMSYNLLKLSALTDELDYGEIAEKQLKFMAAEAERYPGGYSFYLLAVLMHLYPLKKITCVLAQMEDKEVIKSKLGFDMNIRILEENTKEYRLIDDKTTYYVCDNHTCFPPTNNLEEVFHEICMV